MFVCRNNPEQVQTILGLPFPQPFLGPFGAPTATNTWPKNGSKLSENDSRPKIILNNLWCTNELGRGIVIEGVSGVHMEILKSGSGLGALPKVSIVDGLRHL